MNALVAKEIRLIMPAYVLAMLLAIVPVWLFSIGPSVSVVLISFGVLLVAVSSFGREFSQSTFSLLLAQPIERSRIWWTKIGILVPALATAFVAWYVAVDWHASAASEIEFSPGTFVSGMFLLAAVFSGGLWTTLLLRQIIAAFWLTALIPLAIGMVGSFVGLPISVTLIVLGVYSVAGFVMAWWLFYRAQETGWTGGTVVLSGWGTAGEKVGPVIRSRRPLAAMLRKEFQLHQIGLAGIAGLFALHLAAVGLRRVIPPSNGGVDLTITDLVALLWVAVPFVIGAVSVAEERKLGTMEGNLCLPMSSRVQFAIKLLFVIVIGGLLSGTLLWVALHAGKVGVGSNQSYGAFLGVFVSLSLIAFYASTLSRNLIPALVAGAVAGGVVWLLTIVTRPFYYPSGAFDFWPWRGSLVYFIGAPVMAAAFVWLGYRNFRRLSETWRAWRRNLVGWAATLLFIGTATATIYNRAWDYLTPLESRHGPAVITGESRPVLRSDNLNSFVVVLPDGRIWDRRIFIDASRGMNLLGHGIGAARWASLKGNNFVEGSTWVDGLPVYMDMVAIRSDGSLWVSEKPRPRTIFIRQSKGDRKAPEPKPDTLVRFGEDAEWQKVVPDSSGLLLLLKKDGTLWRWEPRMHDDSKKPWPGLRAFQPYRLGTDSDWGEIIGQPYGVYAWKKDGTAWQVIRSYTAIIRRQNDPDPGRFFEPDKELLRATHFDNFKLKSLTQWYSGQMYQAGVREDGTLWAWTMAVPPGTTGAITRWDVEPAIQVGKEANWQTVVNDGGSLVALKLDGTLWRWGFDDGYRRRGPYSPAQIPPERMGSQSDWVAVCNSFGGITALAADGSLWFWWRQDSSYLWRGGMPLMAAPRKPARLGNIFGGE